MHSHNSQLSSLPIPEQEAIAHSERLIDLIKTNIDQKSGGMSFTEYMEQVLYAPGLGYYSAGSRKLGEEGDFVTAPEISSLFSYCLANAIEPATRQYGKVLEVGAGSGRMASTAGIASMRTTYTPSTISGRKWAAT